MTVQPPSPTPAELFTGDISGLFYDGETTPRPATVTVRDGVITNIADDGDKGSAESWDGPVIVPGFIDLHNHGGAGGGFPTGTVGECTDAALYHRERGSTTLWASMVSAPGAELVAQAELLAGLAEQGLIDGIHMEGPFISACRCGAQNPEVIAAGRGYLKSITFAPETANSDEIFKLCAEHGIVASLGHTDADFATMADGIERGRAIGATVTATHLFNAMPQIHHRDPGAAAALISAGAHRDIGLEVIADGVHLDDGTVDMVLNAAPHNAFAITDAMAAAGKPDGEYVLGALGVTVVDGVARLTDGGAIAGGTSTLAEQFARRVNRGASIEQASAFVTGNAAKIAGKTGTLRVGDHADLVVFAKCGDATPEVSIVAGRAMHPR